MSRWVQVREFLEAKRTRFLSAIVLLAGAAVAVGWEVDPVKAAIVSSGALQVLILIAILDLSVTLSKLVRPELPVTSARATLVKSAELMAAIESGRGSASVLAYSGLNSLPVLDALAERGWTVRLLIKHPDIAEPQARPEIEATLARIAASPQLKAAIQIKKYRGASTMHGVLLPGMAAVGWYRAESAEEGRPNIAQTHVLPMVIARDTHDAGRPICSMLRDEVDRLWSEPAPSVEGGSSESQPGGTGE